jgi:uncharacterized short protein YbdD (DUF466 family)
MLARLKSLWQAVRCLSGDDAYERYLAHHAEHHPKDAVQSKEAFFKEWQDSKWKGIKRCC